LYRIVELDEKISILITIIVLSLVFGSRYLITIDLINFTLTTIVSSIAVIPHELAHRWVARKMNCYSRYVLDPFGLVLTLITAIPYIPFKIIMPGYVLVFSTTFDPVYSKRINGIVSYFGPLTNILISIVSIVLLTLIKYINNIHFIIIVFLILAVRLNSWIAFFNLIPIPPLDGSKVINWKPHLWIILFVISIILWILSIRLNELI